MGILEFHFHDCEFSPSMNVGEETDGATSESVAEADEESTSGIDVEPSSSRSRRGKGGVGALVALAALVLLGALVKRQRGGRDEFDEEAASPDVDVSE